MSYDSLRYVDMVGDNYLFRGGRPLNDEIGRAHV